MCFSVIVFLITVPYCQFRLLLSSHFLRGQPESYKRLHEGNYEETLSMTSQGWEMLESSLAGQFFVYNYLLDALHNTLTQEEKQ